MSEFDPNNFTHLMVRRNDERMEKMMTLIERLAESIHDVKTRLTGVESNLADVQYGVDRMSIRLERLERRVGLIDDAFGEGRSPFKGPKS